jgi:hypothetical protein
MLILYVIVFAIMIYQLIQCTRIQKKWMVLFLLEISSIVAAFVLTVIYENLPGFGFMPGLSYLYEIVISFCAGVVYFLVFIVSVLVYFFTKTKR